MNTNHQLVLLLLIVLISTVLAVDYEVVLPHGHDESSTHELSSLLDTAYFKIDLSNYTSIPYFYPAVQSCNGRVDIYGITCNFISNSSECVDDDHTPSISNYTFKYEEQNMHSQKELTHFMCDGPCSNSQRTVYYLLVVPSVNVTLETPIHFRVNILHEESEMPVDLEISQIDVQCNSSSGLCEITWPVVSYCEHVDGSECNVTTVGSGVVYNVYLFEVNQTDVAHSTNLGTECGLAAPGVNHYATLNTTTVTLNATRTARYSVNVVATFTVDNVARTAYYTENEFLVEVPQPAPQPEVTVEPSPEITIEPSPSPMYSPVASSEALPAMSSDIPAMSSPEISMSPSPVASSSLPIPIPSPSPSIQPEETPVASSSGPYVRPPFTRSTAGLIGGLIAGAVLSCCATALIIACGAYFIHFERRYGPVPNA